MTRHGSAEHVNTCRGLRLDQERPEERDEIGKGRTRSGGQGARVLKEVRHDEPDAAHHCRVLSDRLSDLRLAAVVVMREARVMDHPSRKQRTRACGEHRGRDGRRVPRSDPAKCQYSWRRVRFVDACPRIRSCDCRIFRTGSEAASVTYRVTDAWMTNRRGTVAAPSVVMHQRRSSRRGSRRSSRCLPRSQRWLWLTLPRLPSQRPA